MKDPQTLAGLMESVRRFRDEREWRRFHNPKDLAVSITLEAAELLEHFQWKSAEDSEKCFDEPKIREAVAREMADVLILLLSLADVTGIDLHQATVDKIELNAAKYPVDLSRGHARKYDQLERP